MVPRFIYVLEGIFFLALAGVCVYGAIALESSRMLIPVVVCLAVAGFYFYKGLAGRSKDSEVVADLKERIAEVGAAAEENESTLDGEKESGE